VLGSSWNLNTTVFEGLTRAECRINVKKIIFLENRKRTEGNL
jgi:hypothetical protein